MNFASRLKQLRKEHNLTQEELAQKISKTRSTIAGYETERKEPDYETLITLSKYFNVSVGYLLGETNIPHRYEEADEFLSKLKAELNNRGYDFDGKSAEELAEILSIALKLMDKTKSN
ncbi:helix-turn-helix domain-containing protein [Clostridium sp. Cult1]|uniref:helix-turn-helix domain-containing protein n=1 Tax=Clostridium sp. Cult1 TaxID=2079002 RepID=UPI001F1B2BCD|nr:helix-turn-helix transcriptional regulator [Clostridium sp. Cult1]MCF6464165.1 XRE family transcriptional regulator [Clostridium sp. Cult1]